MSKPHKLTSVPQRVRIIGGNWRGRLLPVTSNPALRPTPNRVRETLFNWLQATIEGSSCLDLFAGTGALGFEAASRGAANVIMVDNDHATIDELNQQVKLLAANNIKPICADGVDYIKKQDQLFDVIFLDPPFDQFDVQELLAVIADASVLRANALIYVESPPNKLPKQPPNSWSWRRQGKAGQVAYGLIAT